MDKRSVCLLLICINVCLVIWLVSVQQSPMLEPEIMADFSGTGASGLSSTPQPPQSSANSGLPRRSRSRPNQIQPPSPSSSSSSSNDSSQVVSNSFDGNHLLATPPAMASQTPAPPGSSMHLMDLPNFVYLMDQPACDKDVRVLIFVHSAVRNVEKRRIIRETWADRKYIDQTPLRVIFLVGGVGENSERWQQFLGRENHLHGDLIQGNFEDAYRNMTYKHVMALKWFSEKCAHAQLLVKVDDDVFMNTPQLVKYLATPSLPEHSLLQNPELMLCRSVHHSRVKRSYRSKWRVTYKEYPHRYYPEYCPGMAIVYAPDVVRRLYEAAQKAQYFWVDDVLITGILAEETGSRITPLKYYLEQKDVRQLLSGEADLEDPPFLFTNHAIRPDESMAIWQMALDRIQRPLLTHPASSSPSASASKSPPALPSANISEAQTSSSTGFS
ncbi:lactosylceramide 1,3-N-acetyl-beta-D-glucosaminyltransferase A [Drosophila subpulchrella]|uniref:lactosylceramide 1,3-N-acetyl-beta-D-glucosaminyltransferase A n=1 Tax=Drosophila subpulchrella TaxID=1486046 RepID=UPI0018A18BAE|nr:lactosylceramide 1,3-N-acetyl-beta-D-glucosaminyltransferase A [Drosophila subpulchrella]XP_037720761.1 lactosylceramide 1,3-N-acetyl-beta-D-glucosaminyltransferase A [Drosophila subpulchrella]XP_037720762.1 lactosylceramide 1,3-N-acetyl-beta-D-glucosaminyltransferase A [Drosophila subpulchrella]XP_037720763.1 lactosylceramide 1,3-N-acetyl-beta-D-glucosaminyltransferase A [Drosophila subpulchrella]